MPAGEREALASEIAGRLQRPIDPSTGQPAVTAGIAPRRGLHAGRAHPDLRPDLLVGYAKGTRESSESALGEVPPR